MPAVACPKCGARFRVDKPGGRHACTKCGTELPPLAAAPADRPDPEVSRLERLIEADRASPVAYQLLAQHHLDRGRRDLAIATYRRYLPWAPNDPFVLKRIAALERVDKDPTASAPDPDDPRAARLDIPSPDISKIQGAQRHTRKAMFVVGLAATLALIVLSLWLLRPWLFPRQSPLVGWRFDGRVPCWSPNGSLLAFHSVKNSGSVLNVHDFGSHVTRPIAYSTKSSWSNTAYRWSPDGTELAYEVPTDDSGRSRPAVFRVDARGGTPVRVAWGTTPSWSHDGRQVVMVCAPDAIEWEQDPARQSSVCAVDVITGKVAHLSEPGARNPVADPRQPRVVFQVSLAASDTRSGIPAVELGSAGAPPPADAGSAGDSAATTDPEWTKDATGRFRYHHANDIHIVGLDGGSRLALTNDGRSTFPGFSPDGRRVLFMRQSGTAVRSELWWSDDSGGARERVVSSDGAFIESPADVALVPGSNEVVYRLLLQEVDPGFVGIVIGNVVTADLFVSVPGSMAKPRRVANDHTFKGAFSLSPDGRRIAYEWLDRKTAKISIWVTALPAR